MAQGYRNGRAVPEWHLGSFTAAGGLYSIAADMAKLLRACLTAAVVPMPAPALAPTPVPTPLIDAIRVTLTPRQPSPAGKIGLAWIHSRPGRLQGHLAQRG